jgi:predicted unusual protein kinase regulating ubiquinone biosynthesis (AarF/ABC1/UbiB family)
VSDPEEPNEKPRAAHRSHGRFSRFAQISSVTAGVAARQLGRKVASAFQDEASREESDRRAWAASADQIATTMGQLKGAAMKVGQMLSTDPELLPDEVRDALKTLQSEAPPMPYEMVKAEVERALGQSLDEVYRDFSREPIGAASIGQVHRATLLDGREVAVKVQYPGIGDTIDSDMKNLGTLLTLARAKLPKERVEAYLEEVTEVIRRESDYLFEADTLERFQTVFADVDGVRTPLPVPEFCRRTVLTMEFVDGQRLNTYFAAADEATKSMLAERIICAYIEMIHRHGVLHADPHPGNFLIDKEQNIVFLDVGCVREYAPAFTDGLLTIIEAMWRGDLELLMTTIDSMGFSREGIDAEVIWEWLEIVLTPLLVDKVFDFGAWRVQDAALKFVKDNPEILGFAPPKEAIFYLRVLAGLRGLVGEGGARMNAHRIAKKAAASLRARR